MLKAMVKLASSAALVACQAAPDGVQISHLTAAQVPQDVRALVIGAAPDFVIGEVQKKVREGRTYFDIEGTRADGSALEFDVLMTRDGPEIVEVQRDVVWADVPLPVRAAAEAARPGFVPTRVIESRQNDDAILYELFERGAPKEPAMEVEWRDSKPRALTERWAH